VKKTANLKVVMEQYKPIIFKNRVCLSARACATQVLALAKHVAPLYNPHTFVTQTAAPKAVKFNHILSIIP
jgi:hypothetical protein